MVSTSNLKILFAPTSKVLPSQIKRSLIMNRLCFSYGVACIALLSLTGCEQTREALGLQRNKPDEFTVQPSQGLVVPPNLQELPTPQTGAPRLNEIKPKDKARQALLPNARQPNYVDTSDKSKGEVAILKKAGALEKRDPEIRTTLNREAKVESGHEESFVRDLLSIKSEDLGKVIDPNEEHQRLTGKEFPSDVAATEPNEEPEDAS